MTRTPRPELLVVADDEMLQRRLERMLSPAIRQQLWITFLDDDDRETGVIMPCEDYPVWPDDPCPTSDIGVLPSATVLAHRFAHVMREYGFGSLVAVWERRGSDEVRPPERRWASMFAAAMRERGATVRAQFLLHDRGMRQLAPDDLLDI
jgi:hypothetical protein